MTAQEKIIQIKKFIDRFHEIIQTADVDDDCKLALPRFHKGEENLIAFLFDAGFRGRGESYFCSRRLYSCNLRCPADPYDTRRRRVLHRQVECAAGGSRKPRVFA